MKPETFKTATELDNRIRNVTAAYSRVFESGTRALTANIIDLGGLPVADRDAVRNLALDYLNRQQSEAQAAFDAL